MFFSENGIIPNPIRNPFREVPRKNNMYPDGNGGSRHVRSERQINECSFSVY